jgi:hypothetical protein
MHLRGVKLRFAAGPGRTWALLAGSEAPDSLFVASHVRRWLLYLLQLKRRLPCYLLSNS